MSKNAQIWNLPTKKTPIVRIEWTIYEKRGDKLIEYDASRLWNGTQGKPKGAKLLATIKVSGNDKQSAMWAYKKWVGTN